MILEVADLFCGAGGTSAGAVEAIEMLGHKAQLTAINHWPIAIATHTANHPGARHLCTSLDVVNPRSLYGDNQLSLLWASPECTHHSVARGGKPINDQSRATAWCVVRWAEALRPPVILVENVPEFETWGAIGTNNQPLKSKRGATFLAWVGALESLGYHVDWQVLCAADYGDPTTRRRLFIQAVRGRRKIVWPDPTHAAKPSAELYSVDRKPWVPARDIIDWKIEGQSIYERKRPLSPKTMKRIMAGLEKFGLKPFIVPKEGVFGGNVAQDVEKPLGTVITDGRVHIAQPYLVDLYNEREGQPARVRSIDQPLPTVTASKGGGGLAQPFLVTMEHRGSERDIDRPMPTITTAKGGAIGLVDPFLVKLRGTGGAHDIGDPAPTITAGGTHLGLAQPFLVETAHGKGRPAGSVDDPLKTVCGNRGGTALVQPALLPQQSGGELRPVDAPVPTVATDGAIGLVEPYLVKYFGTGVAASVADPLDTVTAKPRFGLVRPVVVVNGEKYLLDIRFRMLQPHELAGAQGFRKGYHFTGNKSEQVKQIGNAVPRNLARAIVLAVLSQRSDIAHLIPEEKVA
jgi:DNA (cytosine-5)-methyltransferase 1